MSESVFTAESRLEVIDQLGPALIKDAELATSLDGKLLKLAESIFNIEKMADRLGAGPNVDNELRVALARCYAQCARATPPEKSEQAQTFLVKAVETLRTAVQEGYRDRVTLEVEPDLDPLRGLEAFRTLVAGVRPAT